MKILLVGINSKFIHSNLAIHSLKEYSRAYKEDIEIVEYTINHRLEYILQEIYKKKPDVLAFSCYIWNLDYVKDLITELHKVLPNVPIWAGGPEVTYDARSFLEEKSEVKGVMVGEGEKTFSLLAKSYIEGDLALFKIPGIVYQEGDTIVEQLAGPPLDMDELPFIYKDLATFENRMIYYETSRGCPFRCSYCLSSVKEKVRFRSFSLVKEELQFFLDQKVKQVKFVDRTFNCNHKHAMDIWKYLKDHDNGITNFHFEIAADLLNKEELALLATLRPGLVQLEIGVQSTNHKTLKEIDRSMDLEELTQVVDQIHQGANIHEHLDLIVGLPYEDYQSFQNSFDEVYQMQPNQLQLGFLKLLKGSKMYEKIEDYGIVYSSKTPYEVLYTNWISYDEVLILKGVEEMIEVYYNSGQFPTVMNILVKEFASPYACYLSLAQYYEKEGLLDRKHTRIGRYEILLDFLYQQEKKSLQYPIEFYKERLLYDLYLRENLKSRPQWAKELTPYKDMMKHFYKREEEQRVYLEGYESYNSRQLGNLTHLEPFFYSEIGNKVKECYYILFDYRKRNPLSYDAKTYRLSQQDIEG